MLSSGHTAVCVCRVGAHRSDIYKIMIAISTVILVIILVRQ